MTQFTKGMIIKMSGLSVKKENGVFEINSTWEKSCSVYKLKKDGTRIKSKYALDIFNYDKIEKFGEIITLDQLSSAITEINKQLKDRKSNEIIVSYESSDKKSYENKSYIRVIKSIQTTKSIYAISKNSVFQLSLNENWNSVTWQLVGKKGELLSNYNGENMMTWSNKSMVELFEKGYIEIVERVETVRRDIEQTEEVIEEAIETPVQEEAIENIEEVVTFESEQTEITEEVKEIESEVIETKEENNDVTYKLNEEKNGVEIYFSSIPSEEVRNILKANGFRWAKYNKCWYAKQSNETVSFAESLVGEQTTNESNEPVETPAYEYPEIEIDDCTDEKYNISQSLQDREHDANWIFRQNKKDHNKELQELFAAYTNNVKEIIKTLDNQYYIYKIKSALQSFKKNYHSAYVNWLSAKASQPHWAVSGRGNLNKSKYDKALNRQDKWMHELVNLPKELESKIDHYKNKIRKDKESDLKAQLQKELSQPLPDLKFKTVTKEIDLYGNGSKIKSRFYECEGYSIAKLWGAFRIYFNGKEIYSTKSAGTLQDAKAYVSLQIKKDRQLVS